MKRYTVCLQPLDAALTPEKIKAQVERDILHGRAAFYRLGKTSQIAPDKILLEIASKLKPAEVLQYFRGQEESFAVRIEQLRWGWPITSAEKLPITGMTSDRYATAQPQSTENASYTYSRWELVRYIAHLAVNIAAVIYILFTVFILLRGYSFQLSPITSLVNCLMVYMWGYLFFGVRGFPIPYVIYIRSTMDYLEIKYGFWGKPKRLAWSEINQLELPLQQVYLQPAIVRAQHTALRFPTGMERVNQETTLLKTILQRATLVLAEDSGIKLIYRRSDSAAE